MTDEMVGWHHRLNGHEFEQIPGDGEGQGSLVCCSPWGHKRVKCDLLNNSKCRERFFQITVLTEVLETEKGKWLKQTGH